jgi:TetR/AcrR family transcriptional regulator
MWLTPLEALDPNGDPTTEITAYIDRKIEMSRENPKASRLFAMEIMQGAPILWEVLAGPLKRLVDEKTAVIDRWIADGQLAPLDPYHLVFMIWAATQHYADFETQIRALLGSKVDETAHFEKARRTLERVFLKGVSIA